MNNEQNVQVSERHDTQDHIDFLAGQPTVFVDELMNWGWRYGPSCHLHALPGHEDDLHALAAKIGLQRRWFQKKGTMPHYDLTAKKRALAVKEGAKEINRIVLCEHINIWRKHKATHHEQVTRKP